MSGDFSKLSDAALRSIAETGNAPGRPAQDAATIDSSEGEDDGADLLSMAAVGAGAGATTAGLIYGAGKVSDAASLAREATVPGDVDETALRRIHRALQRDKYDLTKPSELKRLRTEVMDAIPKPFTLGDAGKINVQRLLESTYLHPGEGSNLISGILEDRKQGRATRMAKDVQDLVSKNTDYHSTLAELIKNRREQAGQLYDAAYSSGFMPTPEIMDYIERAEAYKPGIIDRAVKKAQLKYPDMDIEKTVLGQGYRQNKRATLSEDNMKALDMVKRSIDDEIAVHKVKDPGVANDLRENILRPFRKLLTTNNPDYGKALSYYSSEMETQEALEAGRTFMKKDPAEMAAYMKTLSPEDKELFRVGAAHELMNQLGVATDNNSSPIKKIIGNPKADPNISIKQQQLRLIFEDPKLFDEFMRRAAHESKMEKREGAVFGNSKTLERAISSADEGEEILKGTTLRGRAGTAMGFLMQHTIKPFARLGEDKREAVRHRVAERLMEPTEFNKTLDALKEMAHSSAKRAALLRGTGRAGAVLGGLGAGAAYFMDRESGKTPQSPVPLPPPAATDDVGVWSRRTTTPLSIPSFLPPDD